MTKIIEVVRPGECVKYRRRGVELTVKIRPVFRCNHPDGPDECPNSDVFPYSCPLVDMEELEAQIVKSYENGMSEITARKLSSKEEEENVE